ncbi:MAG: MotA/TolQ/ExbB proton channel family protein [Cardiobacteriaceae bacterium]|nr:MotA/TolQ/ExbB proton channel family protein [Cardiobacteriaceae bacterium]
MEKNQLSISHLLLDAHIFVQLIMLILLGMFVYAIYVFYKKHHQFKRISALQRQFIVDLHRCQSLEELHRQYHAQGDKAEGSVWIFMMGYNEFKSIIKRTANPMYISQNCMQFMEVGLFDEQQKLEQDISTLGTIGSVAPYVGLLGTVFGIMNSFLAIGNAKNTSIASVAPGIAEALIATGVGLLAAISAVIFYNILSQRANKLSADYEKSMELIDGLLRHDSLRYQEQVAAHQQRR